MAIVLRINNREINEQQLMEEWRRVKDAVANDPMALATPELSEMTLRYSKENIINRVLLEEEAEAMIEDIDFKLIQAEFDKLVTHYQGWEKLQQNFNKQGKGISKFEIKTNIEKSLKVNALLELWAEDVSPPNEGELMSYYDKHPEEFITPSQVRFSKFFLSLNANKDVADDPAELNQKLMENLYEYQFQQKNYDDFLDKALKIPALEYQEDFYLVSGKINAEVEKILRNLQHQELSGIIKTEEGFYLFKRWEEISSHQVDYDKARELIEKKIWEDKKQKKIRLHLQELRKHAKVEDIFRSAEDESSTET